MVHRVQVRAPSDDPGNRLLRIMRRSSGFGSDLAAGTDGAYVPFYASWLNRIEAQFPTLRYFAPDGTDHDSHREQAT